MHSQSHQQATGFIPGGTGQGSNFMPSVQPLQHSSGRIASSNHSVTCSGTALVITQTVSLKGQSGFEHCDLHANVSYLRPGGNASEHLVELRRLGHWRQVTADATDYLVALEELRESQEWPRRCRFVDITVAGEAFSNPFKWCHVLCPNG